MYTCCPLKQRTKGLIYSKRVENIFIKLCSLLERERLLFTPDAVGKFAPTSLPQTFFGQLIFCDQVPPPEEEAREGGGGNGVVEEGIIQADARVQQKLVGQLLAWLRTHALARFFLKDVSLIEFPEYGDVSC